MKHISNMPESLITVGDQLIGQSLFAARSLALILLVAVLIYSIGRSILDKEGITTHYGPLVRGLITFILIGLYVELTDIFSLGITSLTTIFEQPDGFLESLEDMANAGLIDEDDTKPNIFERLFKSIRNLPVLMMKWIQEGMTFGVRLAMGVVRVMVLTFLYLVGPLALAISLIPGFRSTALIWLKAFISIQFWDLTLTVLDNVIFVYNQHYLHTLDSGAGGYLHALTVNVVIIVMYLLVPRLTSLYINASASAGVWGKLGGLAAGTLHFSGLGRGKKPSKKQK